MTSLVQLCISTHIAIILNHRNPKQPHGLSCENQCKKGKFGANHKARELTSAHHQILIPFSLENVLQPVYAHVAKLAIKKQLFKINDVT